MSFPRGWSAKSAAADRKRAAATSALSSAKSTLLAMAGATYTPFDPS